MVMNKRGCCYVCGSSDNNNCVHFAHPLRPVNKKLENFAMGVQPSQRLSTKAVSNSLQDIISDQIKIANIVLNPPFIKLDRRDIPLTLTPSAGSRVSSSQQPQDDDSGSSDSDSDPDYKGINRRSRKNENLPNSHETDIAISNRGRVVPSRQCKAPPKPLSSNVVLTPKKKTRNFTAIKRKRFKRVGINAVKNRNNPSRASLRLFQQLKLDAGKAAKVKRQTRISTRTVELVNQTTEGWREEKSKLLFFVALGLTPIPNTPAVILPSLKIETIPVHVLVELRKKYEQAETERRAIFKEERRIARLRRFERIVNWRQAHIKASAEAPVECIDLASDDESQNADSTERPITLEPQPMYILPDNYPNLTIEVEPSSSSKQNQPQAPAIKRTFSRDFAKPTVIKRIGYGNVIAKNRVGHLRSSVSHRQTQWSPSRGSYPLRSSPNSTMVRRHSPVKERVVPGPYFPVEVTSSVTTRTKRETSSPVARGPDFITADPLSMVEICMPDSTDEDIIVVEDD